MFAAVDLPLRSEMIQVTTAYTLLGAMAATAAALVAMSFAKTMQLSPAAQRRKLTVALSVLLAIAGAAFFSGWAQLSPQVAQDAIERPWRQEYQNLTKNLAESQEATKSLAAEKEVLARSLSESTEQVAQLTSAKEQLQARVEKTEEHLTLAQNELSEAGAKIMKNTAEIEGLKLDLVRSKEQLGMKDAQVEELELVREALVRTTQDAKDAYDKIREELTWSRMRKHYLQAQGRILAVDPGWNFVVMNIGDREGVKAGSPLLVTREGQLIARVQAKSVEPSQTVADIQNASLTKGEKIKPGDTVIFPLQGAPTD